MNINNGILTIYVLYPFFPRQVLYPEPMGGEVFSNIFEVNRQDYFGTPGLRAAVPRPQPVRQESHGTLMSSLPLSVCGFLCLQGGSPHPLPPWRKGESVSVKPNY